MTQTNFKTQANLKPQANLDRLYNLLPAIYRIKDTEQGEPLRALLSVIAEQVNIVEEDIAQLYENWFIETAQDWAVPYIADLIGYESVAEAGEPSASGAAVNHVLVPRREVANTLRSRRRKGTLALLEELARDVANYPGRAVEFYKLLAYVQPLNHLRLERGRSVDVRDMNRLDLLNSPFDNLAHTVDVRRIQSRYQQGRYNIPSVGLFVWRLKTYSVTNAPATCLEQVGPNCFAFSVLGNDAPLFTKTIPERDPYHITNEKNLPVPIRRRALAQTPESYYGEDKSFYIWKGVKRGNTVERQAIPAQHIVVADLSDWVYRPRRNTVAVDPVLGRIVFPPGQLPSGVWVSYHYGFSADIGGGEYSRSLETPLAQTLFYQQVSKHGEVSSVEDALYEWQKVRTEKPRALIEITDSDIYDEQLTITLRKGENVEIRAANRKRPVIYLLDRERNRPDALTIISEGENAGGCLTLDGLLITGRAVHVEGGVQRVTIRHCTLVPGWTLEENCHPKRPNEPSLELYLTNAKIEITHSILGTIQVYADEVSSDPLKIHIDNSILDATGDALEAIGAPNWPLAHAVLTLRNVTVFGQVQTHAIKLAENSIFTGKVRVARRQFGCMRFCYVPEQSRTPRRYRCQPDLVEGPIRQQDVFKIASEVQKEALLEPGRLRVRPQFDSTRYGTPTYARLSQTCAEEILRGAEDTSEMGALHDLYQPQRLANLRTRLEEYSPARTDSAVILAD
jgi:hypothetical protein